jgi:uncharacterized protein YjdB
MRLLLLAFAVTACARPDHIEIDPRAPRLLHKGEAVRLHAKMTDRSGKIFSQERASWTSRDPFVAGVDANGAVTALSSGHTVVIGLDGHALRDREVHLASDNPAVARVDPDGRVWAVTPGDAVVRAKSDDKEAELRVHVR